MLEVANQTVLQQVSQNEGSFQIPPLPLSSSSSASSEITDSSSGAGCGINSGHSAFLHNSSSPLLSKMSATSISSSSVSSNENNLASRARLQITKANGGPTITTHNDMGNQSAFSNNENSYSQQQQQHQQQQQQQQGTD